MNSDILQLLVLAGIVVFMVMRLRSALGTRDGYEGPSNRAGPEQREAPELEVIEGGPDRDIIDHAHENSETANALTRMKAVQSDFHVGEFFGGARGAYEMILMAFENGEMDSIKDFLSQDVFDAFDGAVQARAAQSLTVEAQFVGIREMELVEATFVDDTRRATIDVKFVGEMTSVVRDSAGNVVEGDPNKIKRQKDVWSFSRIMGSDDPNWQLVATGE